MKTGKLGQSYRDELIKAGVESHRAEQAAKSLTWEQLMLISEIWLEWTPPFSQVEGERLASMQ